MWPRLVAAAVALTAAGARAWIYPEHRDLANAGVQRLDPEARAALEALWARARPGFQSPERLCAQVVQADGDAAPGCLDFGALPALAGDHSCSPNELALSVVPSDWSLGVARVAHETKQSLGRARSHQDKLNRIARSNLQLQQVDADYATRAGANNAHFLLPRAGNAIDAYVFECASEGAPLNGVGLYVQYHAAALARAQALASAPDATAAMKAALARDALALEAYALHWLEDAFAAGHVVGTWGATAWRKGTHDFYNEFGVDTVDWDGAHLLAFGDANLRPADLERAARAVATSLAQLADALRPGDALGTLAQRYGPGADALVAFDSCREERQPVSRGAREVVMAFLPQLRTTPVAGRGEDDVHLPRFREELGPFIGSFASVAGGVNFGGQGGTNFNGTLAAGLRVGFGAESLTGTVGTGIAFLEAGLTMESAQLASCGGDPECEALGVASIFPRVPARSGLRVGLRLPFFLLPGDTLLLAPVLALVSPRALSFVALEAANGGLIPWQTSVRTRAGVFQVVLGRQVSATFYGLLSDIIEFVPATAPDGSDALAFARARSLSLSFPVVEWTPFRTFATQLTYATPIQLGVRLEVPLTYTLLAPAEVTLKPVPLGWSVFLRLQFDARYFFGSREDLSTLKKGP